MIKRRMPLNIELGAASEYSKDGGNTWTALAADTAVEIEPTELASDGVLKIRSSDVVESIDPNKLGFRSRLFDHINLKNGKTLTSSENLFDSVIAKSIRASNIENVTTASGMFRLSRTDSIFVGSLPEVNSVRAMFNTLRSNIISNVIFGKSDVVVDYSAWMFANSQINIIGDIVCKGKAITDIEGTFYGADIDMFPFIDMTLSSTYDAVGDREHVGARFMRGLKSKYILEGNLFIDKGDESTSTRDTYTKTALVDNDSTDYGAFAYMQARFSGLSIVGRDMPYSSYSYTSRLFYGSSSMLSPFRLIASMGYGFTDNISTSIQSTKILEKVTQEEIDEIKNSYCYMEIPDWMEDVIELEVIESPVVVGATSIAVKDNDLEIYKADKVHKPLSIASKYSQKFDDGSLHGITADQIFGSRNGIRVHRNGSEFKVFDVDGVLTSTITDTANIVSASMSEDGALLYLIVAQSYDTVAGGDQQLTGSIRTYSSATGSLVEENVLSLPSSHQLIGAWKPNSGSNLQIVMRKWEDDGEGNFVEVNSVVNSEKSGIITKTISLSLIADMVAPNYAEDNEFVCVNTTTGQVSRCFGK